MAFTTAIFSQYSGPETNKQLTDVNWNIIGSALATLAGNSLVAKFFSSLPSAAGAITIRRDPDTQMNAFWRESERAVSLTDSIYGGFTARDPSGSGVTMDFSRILFHELTHAKYHDADTGPVSEKDQYRREERNVFLENVVYRVAFGGRERVGHGPLP